MISEEKLKKITEELEGESYFLAVFYDIGNVGKSVAINNVIPEQLLALGGELEMIGKNGILMNQQQQAQQQQEKKIAIPKSTIKTP